MDKSGKLFGKISIIDLFVILILLAIIGGTIYRFASPATAVAQGDVVINFTARIDGVRDFTLEYYQIGLPVFDRMANQQIGRIVGVRYEPQYAFGIAADGRAVHAPRPGIMVVFVDIETDGRETEQAIFAAGTYELRVGSIVHFATRYVEVQATVDAITSRPR